MTDVSTTTTCPDCHAAMRAADTFCWTCGSPRGTGPAPDRLAVVHHAPAPDPGPSRTERRGTPRRGQDGSGRVVAGVAVAVVAAAAVAGWWLVRPDDDVSTTPVAAPSPSTSSSTSTSTPVREVAAATPAPAVAAPVPPPTPEPVYPTGVLTPARVTAPGSSPDSADAGGRTTTYVAANVLDADPSTAWRTEGSAAGSSLTFTFDAPVRVTEVGLINGFAKVDPHDGTDRYPQGRRVLAVTWTFQGPTGPVSVPQRLSDGERDLQRIPVPAVVTSSATLTVDEVTRPGAGRLFDRTAISEVRFTGA
ncbi:discoidin domain-containing protein [Kineococcus radiotolerans]|uniref:discoidin domain-containing protein n=1 Tax=Kineococcus radiotolerans TaxID=131568 RepID=UPI000324974D|nr:discoidin domain-containing protein [Kineococcus radiotolerans]